jgi:hypothetical protein
MADCFAFVNHWTYNQIMRFNFRRNIRTNDALERYAREELHILGEVLEDHPATAHHVRDRGPSRQKQDPAEGASYKGSSIVNLISNFSIHLIGRNLNLWPRRAKVATKSNEEVLKSLFEVQE